MSDQVLTTIITVVIGGGITVGIPALAKRGDHANAIIDQLQEDRDKDRQRLDRMEAELVSVRQEVARLQGRDQLWGFHATRIETQVRDLGGVPHERPIALREDMPHGD